jgi:hypothetical protein
MIMPTPGKEKNMHHFMAKALEEQLSAYVFGGWLK